MIVDRHLIGKVSSEFIEADLGDICPNAKDIGKV
jgi:hypothetical protein